MARRRKTSPGTHKTGQKSVEKVSFLGGSGEVGDRGGGEDRLWVGRRWQEARETRRNLVEKGSKRVIPREVPASRGGEDPKNPLWSRDRLAGTLGTLKNQAKTGSRRSKMRIFMGFTEIGHRF